MKILIIDDDQQVQNELRKDLASLLSVDRRFEFQELNCRDFEANVNVLKKRRDDLLDRGTFDLAEPSAFDMSDVIVVENDLTQFRFGYTAEFVAYHARCFSRCGFVVGVDQYGKNSFDLTLHDHPQSFADLNVGSKQLVSPGLWKTEGWESFRPWAWPLIPDAVTRLQNRSESLSGRLDEPVFAFLGFEKIITELLPREIVEFVSRKKEITELADATIRDFVFESGNGLDRKDAFDKVEARRTGFPEDLQCRIAAARLGKWLECLVLPCQDIIVDAPHLIRRFPSLLKSGERTLASANEVARLGNVAELGIDLDRIEEWRFKHADWLSRPGWFFDPLRRCEAIAEVKDPWSGDPLDAVFCEDTSRFAAEEECRAFEAELPTPDNRRWVRDLSSEGISYEPEVRFAL